MNMKNNSETTNYKAVNLSLLLVTLLILTLFQSQNANAEHDVNGPLYQPKIITGTPSKQDAWPWMAALLIADVQGSAYDRRFCGGTLVAPQWILTAAHCVDEISDIEVFLGEIDLYSRGGETIPVSKIVSHPNYNADTKSIATQRVKTDIPLNLIPNH